MFALIIHLWLSLNPSVTPEQCVQAVYATVAPDMTDDEVELADELSATCGEFVYDDDDQA